MLCLFLASGFEETEALVTLDILRRAQLETATVGVGGRIVTGAHGIPVTADVMDSEVVPDEALKGIVLPGGMPGTLNLEKSETVQSFIDYTAERGGLLAAICAAPSILGHKGLLRGKKAVCFPGFEEQLEGAEVLDQPVCRDGNIITGWGAGGVFHFGLEIVKYYLGAETAERLGASMKCVL